MNELILLVGYRGVGKTTIGRALADSLGFRFLDTDEEVVRKRGTTIADIVTRQGWSSFRQSEEEVLAALPGCRRMVVSTGGGAVEHQHLWKDLRRHCVVVWLTADREVILERIRCDDNGDTGRPALTDAVAMEEEIAEVLQRRNPLYKEIARFTIDTGRMSVEEAVAEVERRLLLELI